MASRRAYFAISRRRGIHGDSATPPPKQLRRIDSILAEGLETIAEEEEEEAKMMYSACARGRSARNRKHNHNHDDRATFSWRWPLRAVAESYVRFMIEASESGGLAQVSPFYCSTIMPFHPSAPDHFALPSAPPRQYLGAASSSRPPLSCLNHHHHHR